MRPERNQPPNLEICREKFQRFQNLTLAALEEGDELRHRGYARLIDGLAKDLGASTKWRGKRATFVINGRVFRSVHRFIDYLGRSK